MKRTASALSKLEESKNRDRGVQPMLAVGKLVQHIVIRSDEVMNSIRLET
jgi:hypothetical protein